jgi:hypothetical protein
MDNFKMELCRDIFIQGVMQGKIQISFEGTEKTIKELIEGQCYRALQKIKAIIEDDSLGDKECFQKIEEIICVLEEVGSNGGSRHDFG